MKKALALLLAMVLFLVSACGTKPQETATPEQTPSAEASKDWIVADIAGNVTAQTSVKETDDFHVAVNKDWLTSVDMSGGTVQVSTCSSLSKLILMSSSMIGSLNLMDFNHCPLAWRSG